MYLNSRTIIKKILLLDMGRIMYVCATCSEHFTRRYSATRHNLYTKTEKERLSHGLNIYITGQLANVTPAIHLCIVDVAENAFITLSELWLQTPWEILSDLEVCKDNNKGNTNFVRSNHWRHQYHHHQQQSKTSSGCPAISN